MSEPSTPAGEPPETTTDQVSLGARLRQPRTILSLALPLVMLVLVFRVALNVDFAQLVASIGQANKLLLLVGVPGVLCGLPAARLPLDAPAARDRLPDRDARCDRDPVPVVAGELPRAGQARATCTGPTC